VRYSLLNGRVPGTPYGGTLLWRQAPLHTGRALAVWRIYRRRENWQSRLWKNGQSRPLRTGKAGGEEEATLWLVEGKHRTTLPG
jgi:hypothetical protein